MSAFSKFLLTKCFGWKIMEPICPEKKCIILGVPHTSIWDLIISWLYYNAAGGTANVLVKKEAFVWPIGFIVRRMGGIPVDRKGGGSALVRQVIHSFNEREYMHLAIAPEGTRKATTRWKTGFHTIARAANVPVYLGYYDWGRKEVGRGEKIELTDDPQADLKRIRQWYKDKGVQGKYPEMVAFGDDLD